MKTISIITSPELLTNPRFLYTIAYINGHPLAKEKVSLRLDTSPTDQTLHYGHSSLGDWNVKSQNLFFDQTKTINSDIYLNQYKSDNASFFSVEKKPKEQSHFCEKGTFSFDLFETIFFHISRYEEIFANNQDCNSSLWLKEDLHKLVQNKLEKQAVVDQLIAAFIEVLIGQKMKVKTSHNLSHDIDLLYRFKPFYKIPKTILGILWYRRGLKYLVKSKLAIFKYLFGISKDPYDVYEWLFSERDIAKTCYFMAGGETSFDNNYRISDPKIKALISLLRERNYTLGLHPSYNASIKVSLYQDELRSLGNITKSRITHSRQHCLRWDWEKTPYIIENQGIKQDSSLGYNRRIGFRCGTGFAYKLYDFKNERAFNFIEQPMAFMESSLVHEAHKNIDALSHLYHNFISDHLWNTHIESNWHNSNFDESMWFGKPLKSLYKQYLDQCIS